MDGDLLSPLGATQTALVRYDAARRALAEATQFDDIKHIRDVAVAAQAYAREAKDRQLIDSATDIRKWAERHAGEKLAEMAGLDERPKGRKKESHVATLSDLGITKTQSSRWQQLARMSDAIFQAHVALAKKSAVASLDRAMTQADKRERRATREQELADKTVAASQALGTKLYGVIYADPPWKFQPYSDETGMDRAADNHYPTEALDKIKALDVPAAEDAVLFLWATVPMLTQALEVMAAWGFAYKSHFVWIKDKAGTGYWNRNKHELLLIGTRGSVPAPAPGDQYESAIEAKVQEHSRKPFHFREIIKDMFPTLPRIELFAREQFGGWDSWGNEA